MVENVTGEVRELRRFGSAAEAEAEGYTRLTNRVDVEREAEVVAEVRRQFAGVPDAVEVVEVVKVKYGGRKAKVRMATMLTIWRMDVRKARRRERDNVKMDRGVTRGVNRGVKCRGRSV